MLHKKSNITVFTTSNYEAFHQLPGNRAVLDGRKQRIVESILKCGFLPAPIIVNERMDVIDGQGRLAACKELGIEVPYVIQPGLGATECREMNRYQKVWNAFDFIRSYAELGDKNYMALSKLVAEFPRTKLSIVLCAFSESGYSSVATESLVSGSFKASVAEAIARDRLQWLESFRKFSGRGKPTEKLMWALLFASSHVSREQISERFESYSHKLSTFSTRVEAIVAVDVVVNFNMRANRVDLVTAFSNSGSFFGRARGATPTEATEMRAKQRRLQLS